jgi:hypothetical protein
VRYTRVQLGPGISAFLSRAAESALLVWVSCVPFRPVIERTAFRSPPGVVDDIPSGDPARQKSSSGLPLMLIAYRLFEDTQSSCP